MSARTAAVLTVVLALAGCSSPGKPGPRWDEISLPAPQPVVLRDAVHCGDRWYVVGALQPPGADPSPAAWESSDGRAWRSVRISPLPGSYYGPRNVLYSVACAGGRIAALGAQSGGAHGNPRTSSWVQRPDGALAEVAAPFDLYGGDEAVDAGRITGGPAGFLIVGNRTSGPAAWISADGTRFKRHEVGEKGSLARDGVVLADRYLMVGGPAAGWESADGIRWTEARLDGVEAQRVTVVRGDVIAAGQRGETFGAWRWRSGSWTGLGSFGTATPAGLRSLTAWDGHVVAAADRVWSSPDGQSWDEVTTPVPPVATAGAGPDLLLLGAGRAWLAHPV